MPKRSSSDGAQLRSAIAALNHRLRKEDAPGSIGPTGLGILGLLSRAGAASASELAEMANVQPQSLTRALAGLERDKLIGRRPDEADRRRAIMWLTPKGEDLLRTTMRKRVTWLNAALGAQFNEAERETLRSALPLLERLASRSEADDAPSSDLVFNLIPFTQVRDVRASVEFYETLGFVVDGEMTHHGELAFASMHAKTVHAARIMFQRACEPIAPQAQRIQFYCWTDDLAALHRRLVAQGVSPGPISFPDHIEEGEFTLVDPDGYRLTVGQPKRTR